MSRKGIWEGSRTRGRRGMFLWRWGRWIIDRRRMLPWNDDMGLGALLAMICQALGEIIACGF